MTKEEIKPKVFISYAWGSKENQEKVISFANSLVCEYGIDVILDRWNLKEGNDKYSFMEKCVTDPTVTNVLLLLDENYTKKADSREGGVGSETQIISAELYGKVSQTKFIPIIFEKGANGEIFKPAYLKGILHIDLSDADYYDENIKYSIKILYGKEIYKKPPLGKKPAWVDDESAVPVKTQVKYSSIAKATNPTIQKMDFEEMLNEVIDDLLKYDVNDIPNGEEYYSFYLSKYNGTIPIRDKYLNLLKVSVYVSGSESLITDFFENIYNRCLRSRQYNSEIYFILIHEMFIYTISFFLKKKLYKIAGYILGKTYFTGDGNISAHSYDTFYCTGFQILDKAVRLRDNKQYITGTGQLWKENINTDFCLADDFIFADIMCYNYSIFTANKKVDSRWFALTYVYVEYSGYLTLSHWIAKLQSMEFVKQILPLFNYENENGFISKFREIESARENNKFERYRYPNAFNCIPLLCDYIKSTEIGKYE